MICQPCRKPAHISGPGHMSCPELARQQDATLTATERAGGSWCDCQHQPPAPGKP